MNQPQESGGGGEVGEEGEESEESEESQGQALGKEVVDRITV